MRLITSPWHKQFDEFLVSTKNSLEIVSPFIKNEQAKIVSQKLDMNTSLSVLTRFNIGHFEVGISDIEAIDTFHQRKAHIISNPSLHAKIYLSDKKRAIITSGKVA